MKLKKVIKALKKCAEVAGDSNPEVEIWFGDRLLSIVSIGQFGVIADVTIHVEEVEDN